MNDERERRLTEALFDEGRATDSEDLSTELEELREAEQLLERAAQQERAALLTEGHDAELEAQAAQSLQRIMEGERAGPRGRWLPWLLAGAVAAAALGFAFLREPPEGLEQPLPLGPEALVLEAPLGPADDYGTFRWTGELPAGGWFELELWDSGAAPGAPPILKRELQEPRWKPADPAGLPDSLRWEVRAWSASGELLGSDRGQASRSSP